MLPLVTVTWRGDLEVRGLLDVSSSWSGVEGGDESRELSLQDEVVVPRPPATSFGLILLLLLQDGSSHILIITPSDITSRYSLLMPQKEKVSYQDLLVLLVLLIVVFILIIVVVGLREVLLVVQLSQ